MVTKRHYVHPYVKLKPPRLGCAAKCGTCDQCKSAKRARKPYWSGVWDDPDTKKETSLKLDHTVLSKYLNGEKGKVVEERARAAWASDKSREIMERLAAIQTGVNTTTGMSIEDAVEKFFENKPNLRVSTIRDYRTSMRIFSEWCVANKVTCDNITRPDLVRFTTYAFKLPSARKKVGASRAEIERNGERRDSKTVNGDLTVVGMLLRWLRKMTWLPQLNLEDIIFGLEKFDEHYDKPEFLWPKQLQQLITAGHDHDAEVFDMTRDEKARNGERKDSAKGETARYTPILPLIFGAKLSGMRLDELCLVDFKTHLNLNASDWNEEAIGEINLRSHETKTKTARSIGLEVSPGLRRMIVALRDINHGKGTIFGVTYDEAQAAMKRLRDEYNAPPEFTWQVLRSTCDTYLNNAPGIYNGAGPHMSGRQLGHSPAVAQKHYVGLIRGIPATAKTLEAAMKIEKELNDYCEMLEARVKASNVIDFRKRRRASDWAAR